MDLIDDRAVLDNEEDDESFDEDTGEVREKTNGTNGGFDDSSEEEEDDDDEEAAAEVAKDFIVDEDEEDEEARRERRRERKKRRREEREDEGLDEEDLELIGLKPTEEAPEPKFKRLKRGPREDRDVQQPAGVNEIFGQSDEEEETVDYTRRSRPDRRGLQDEFEDFIEEDVFSDEEQQRQREDEEVARPNRRGLPDLGIADAAGLDEQALEDFRAAFGDGTDYDFALEKEEEADEVEAEKDKHLDLKDVFEPSQLAEKMLTDEDNLIRHADEPERHQLARKPYRHVELTEDEFKEEASWIANLMLPGKQFTSDLQEPFRRAIGQVLEFMVRDDYEVPFIFQNRKDYLLHVVQKVVGRDEDGNERTVADATRLLVQRDLWQIFEHDLKYRALIEKRQALQKTYDDLRSANVPEDSMFQEMLPLAATMEELQDLQDYLYFQYASQLKDMALTSNGETNGINMSQKKASTRTVYEEIRASKAFGLVRAFGITADGFAQNAARQGVRTYAEDPSDSPENLADTMIDEEFPTGTKVLKAAKSMFTEELTTNPRFRGLIRRNVYIDGVIDCHRTEKGLKKIDEQHPYYEFKYLRNQDFRSFSQRPDLFLKMLKAEEEGLIEVIVRLQNPDNFKKQLYKYIETDNYSTTADAWNAERRDVVSAAVDKVMKLMGRLVKENLKEQCENAIGIECREEFNQRLDQAPYQPRGMKKGTTPRVLTLSNGGGTVGRDPIYWAYVNDDGRVLEHGQFKELGPGDRERGLPDGKDVEALLEVIKRREPEVIGVSGWSPETRKLQSNLATLVSNHDLRGPVFADEDDRDRSELLEVIMVNDEVARMYQTSDRAKHDHPGFPQLALYCVALARYMQDPLKEYAALGRDIVSISFHPAQNFLPQEKLLKKLEMALVDTVNMVGVDINEATSDSAIANLLPYVAGLGPRKASHLLKVMNLNGGVITTREDLLGLNDKHSAMGFKVWSNAAATLYIPFEPSEPTSEYLDGTRVHPEDYDIARKMAADALELDEEDIEAERQEGGSAAIVRRLIREEAQERVNDLVLEEYAEQLEKNLNAKKRTTLENIRAELNEPYEELRNPFRSNLGESEIFTMLTGETRESLQRGMNVPISLKRITDTHVEGKLDCGLTAVVEDGQWSDTGMSPKQLYTLHQTVQAHITSINRKDFSATVSLRDDQLKKPFKRYNHNDRNYDEWDDREEAKDRKLLEEKADSGSRATRVVKHPLFRPFNAKQAEEYLANQNRGDVVIRPSSKGTDHLAVTWKVADGIFQHIDVLELDKENEFALGRTLRIGGRYNYSDLDELIVLHVKAMARKVDEMCGNEKFQDKSKAALEEWLTTYTNANPKRSMYQFCINRERPGQFHLVFKAGQNAKLMDWSVRVIPQGFELMKQPYPTMRDLCNGFKLIFQNMHQAAAMGRGGRR
ncbi:transcription elongation factor SPT6 [Capronia coronata CBS 617.96]|uniref:Transcription elongation factor Spt6 n=1 Tax=Capronia coronata CBS 617.96 TaxID=1182541 RepID=W9Y907_9EURO|nr:transcription elongation factor SPT6 [Capronia coronata CBS 617.96]EXJ85736.1 transcription elongation factor SPT6 [Capronia coronata CBS 617.96]